MAIYVLAGTPGIGKTTILKVLLEKRPEIKVVDFGWTILETAVGEKLVKNRDELRNLAAEQHDKYVELQSLAAERISIEVGHPTHPVIIDTHVAIKTPGGYLPGMPEKAIKTIAPEKIILLEASPKIVLERRAKDQTRVRNDFGGEKEIIETQELNKAFAAAAANSCSAILAFMNADGTKEQNAELLSKLIK